MSDDSDDDNARTLTAELLNNEIVKMRALIAKARRFSLNVLMRQKKSLEKAVQEGKSNEKSTRKLQRILEEIKAASGLNKDEVTKFALTNKKPLSQLYSESAPVGDRLLKRVACDKAVIKEIEKLRKKYDSFDSSTPFLLQRLGLQYSGQKKDRVPKPTAKSDDDSNSDEVSGKGDDSDDELSDNDAIATPEMKRLGNGKRKVKTMAPKIVRPASKAAKGTTPKKDRSLGTVQVNRTTAQGCIKRVKLSDVELPLSEPSISKDVDVATADIPDDEGSSFFLAADGQPKVLFSTTTAPPEADKRKKPAGKAKSTKTDELHPSWIAKQKQREQLAAAPSGKRIVFD